jgi:uncharacterized membrane protein
LHCKVKAIVLEKGIFMDNGSQGNTGGTGMGMVIGLLLVIVVVVLFFFFRSYGGNTQSAPSAPSAPAEEVNEGGDASIEIPEEVDININDGQ